MKSFVPYIRPKIPIYPLQHLKYRFHLDSPFWTDKKHGYSPDSLFRMLENDVIFPSGAVHPGGIGFSGGGEVALFSFATL